MLLDGRSALVTGGAGRLGKAIAAAFLEEGARVVLLDRDAERLAEVAHGMSADHPRNVAAVVGDLASAEDIGALFAAAEAALALPDVIVNAHGIYPNTPLVDVSAEEWDAVFAVNVRATMLLCQAAARAWIAGGVAGVIVNISSGAATSPRPGGAHYSGSKAAVDVLTKVLAMELGPSGIRANAISPGVVLDEVYREESDENAEYINLSLRSTPLRRTGAPRDVAEAAVFLASDRAAWITGANLEVSGGAHCGRTHLPFTPQYSLGPSRL